MSMKKITETVKFKTLVKQNFGRFDIRGVSFEQSNLTGVNFSESRAGLTLIWKFIIILVSLFLSILAGIILSYAGRLIGLLIFGEPTESISEPLEPIAAFGWVTLGALAFSFTVLIRKEKFRAALTFLTIFLTSAVITTIIFIPENQAGDNILASILFLFFSYIGVMTGFAIITEVIVTLGIATENASKKLLSVLSSIFTILGAILATAVYFETWELFIMSWFLTLSGLILAVYISGRVLGGEPKYSGFRSLAILFCSRVGTNFQGADLTDANFTQATLGNTDFRGANLTRTCWLNTRNIEEARVEKTYLENEKVRQLLVTGNGQNQNFDGLDLRGCNLKNANLTDASLIGTKLSEATLEGANLLRAKLVRTQLYGANLKNANLTGACIQDWAISTDTQFEGVQCEYVYMRLETKEDPDPWRKPDNRNETFKEGDFNDFIAPIVRTQKLYKTQNIDLRDIAQEYKTLDLFHYDGVEPSAAAAALQKLIEKYPEAGLKVVTMEGRGQDKIRLQAQVKGEVNRSILSQEYTDIYNKLKSGTASDLKSFLAGVAEKDQQINRFQELLGNAIQQPKFYVETYQESKGNITISGVQGDISGVAAAGENQSMTGSAVGDIQGQVTNQINQSTESTQDQSC